MDRKKIEYEKAKLNYDDPKYAFNMIVEFNKLDNDYIEYIEGVSIIIDHIDDVIDCVYEAERQRKTSDELYNLAISTVRCASSQVEEAIGNIFDFLSGKSETKVEYLCSEIAIVLVAVVCTNISLRSFLSK